ncbi:39S ribosomal protein L30, mitochondrial [Chionoecetes opilio]|uniref:Large ribosomal subunit protein uL30m n=1 Tax=Chionoecetes opilio TaxID=41210 RepID=A0A8J8WKU2_CHIOP|nr:39S ribosomal protein L30, mitochondrial [Chionoecetes opilio]
MFGVAARKTRCAAGRVGVRHRSYNSRKNKKVIWQTGERTVPSSQPATWSTGEVKHPGKLDCPLGNLEKYPKPMPDGGMQYFGFQYYPRHPGKEEPPCEPLPLHLVTRVKSLQNKPWWDREIMQKLGLTGKRNETSIVKNSPQSNALLWKVKHLVKVTPIRLPDDQLDNCDPRCCFLKEDGEFSVTPTVHVEDAHLEEDPKLVASKWDKEFVDRHTRKNWQYPWQLKLC